MPMSHSVTVAPATSNTHNATPIGSTTVAPVRHVSVVSFIAARATPSGAVPLLATLIRAACLAAVGGDAI